MFWCMLPGAAAEGWQGRKEPSTHSGDGAAAGDSGGGKLLNRQDGPRRRHRRVASARRACLWNHCAGEVSPQPHAQFPYGDLCDCLCSLPCEGWIALQTQVFKLALGY